jgi:hypothetical protein
MADAEVALLVGLYVVLLQAFSEAQCAHILEDDVVMDCNVGGMRNLDSQHLRIAMSTAALYDYRLAMGLLCFDDDLRYWVKPRCTLWFSQFLMSLYEDSRWIEFFRMDKGSVATMCYRVWGAIEKQNTKYRLAIPVEVRVCCTLYKLAQGANFLACSEKFAIGRSTISIVIWEVVRAINSVYRDVISWPRGADMRQTMLDFKSWCGMPSVQGALDCTHIAISKPADYPEDYWYFKTGAYSKVAQTVVNVKKMFTSIYVGLPSSVNDQRVLRRSGLWHEVVNRGLMSADSGY